ncbi:MAG: hypothetical protein AAGH64_09005 [Planctomycetota bacterium]
MHLSAAIVIATLVSPAPAQVEEFWVDPTATDLEIRVLDEFPDADSRDLRHRVAIDASSDPPEFLFVFVPGSGGLPSDYTEVVRHAAERGLASVGIAYPNLPSLRDLLAGVDDLDEPERIRRERVYGEPLSEQITVERSDSFENRLAKLIVWLGEAQPSAGWDRFVTEEGTPRWERIVIAGHSQGAGHAAYMMKERRLAGALMYAGPGDVVPNVGRANWLFRDNVTPAIAAGGFVHIDDFGAPAMFEHQRIVGLEHFDPIQSVGAWPADSLTSRRLTKLAPPPNFRGEHGVDVVDD